MKMFTLLLMSVAGCLLISSSLSGAAQKEAHARSGNKPTLIEGERLYRHYCAPCHGDKGDGKGFNAEFLDPKPANHTDSAEMGKRTDEKLFDTVHGGGKEVAKSTYMPPWGETFSGTQIDSLVLQLRKLCNCAGPE